MSAPGACFADCDFAEARHKADQERLAAAKARLKAATPGPWRYESGAALHGIEDSATHYVSDVVAMADDDPPLCSFYSRADAEFVAAAPEDIEFLLHYVETLASRLQAMTVRRDRYRTEASELRQSWEVKHALLQDVGKDLAAVTKERDLAREDAASQSAAAERDLVHWADRFNAVTVLTCGSDGTAFAHTGHMPHERDLQCPACWAAAITDALRTESGGSADARRSGSAH